MAKLVEVGDRMLVFRPSVQPMGWEKATIVRIDHGIGLADVEWHEGTLSRGHWVAAMRYPHSAEMPCGRV